LITTTLDWESQEGLQEALGDSDSAQVHADIPISPTSTLLTWPVPNSRCLILNIFRPCPSGLVGRRRRLFVILVAVLMGKQPWRCNVSPIYVYVSWCHIGTHYTYHFSSAGWGFPILAAAAFVRAVRVRLRE
jgi:hypothetical protein